MLLFISVHSPKKVLEFQVVEFLTQPLYYEVESYQFIF